MTVSQIQQIARDYLKDPKTKVKLIRKVYNHDGRAGLRCLAEYITALGGNKIRANDLRRQGRLDLNKVGNALQNVTSETTLVFRLHYGSEGKAGKLGGRTNVQKSQVYQSI